MNSYVKSQPGSLVGTSASSKVYFGWWVVFASFIGVTLGASTLTIFGLGMFIKPLEAEFGWTRTQIASANTIVSFSVMLIAMLQGVLIDKFGVRKIVLTSVPLLGLSVMSLYFLPANLAIFYFSWIAISLCGLGTWSGSYTKVTVAWFEKRLGLALGFTSVGVGVGAAIVPPIALALQANFGWRLAYVGLGLLSIVVVLPIVWAFIFDKPSDKGVPREGEEAINGLAARVIPDDGLTFKQAAATSSFKYMLAAFILLGFTTTGIATHQIPMLIDGGNSPARAAFIQSMMGLGLIFGRLAAGYLLDKMRTVVVAVLFLSGPIIGFLGYSLLGVASGYEVLWAVLIGAGIGGEFDLLGYYIRRYFGRISFGKLYGVLFGLFQFGAGIGAVAIAVGRAKMGGYPPMLMLMAFFALIATLLLTRLGPQLPSPAARASAAKHD